MAADMLNETMTTPAGEIVAQLRERMKLKYMGDCECGQCQLVPAKLIEEAAATIELAMRVLKP